MSASTAVGAVKTLPCSQYHMPDHKKVPTNDVISLRRVHSYYLIKSLIYAHTDSLGSNSFIKPKLKKDGKIIYYRKPAGFLRQILSKSRPRTLCLFAAGVSATLSPCSARSRTATDKVPGQLNYALCSCPFNFFKTRDA
eukprot:1136505-Pelagomonas_calceolata.AAC.1